MWISHTELPESYACQLANQIEVVRNNWIILLLKKFDTMLYLCKSSPSRDDLLSNRLRPPQ